MSESVRLSGKRFKLPTSVNAKEWKWSVRPGGWVVLERPDGKGGIIRQRLMMSEVRGQLSANLHGTLYSATLLHETRGHGGSAGGDSDLTAQFPGKVRKVLVAAGAEVAEGTPMILVEAMKMEFTIKAPADGKVTKLLVTEGQQLSPGDRFFDFEPREENGG